MFFQDEPLSKKRGARIRCAPPIPNTGWRPPSEFPNLSAASVIGFDVETKETDFARGPGWARGRGQICGFSIAARARGGETGKWYFPIRHEVAPEWNLDPNQCLAWLSHQLNTPHIPKVGANLLYDIGWLSEENIAVKGKLHDVQFAEALIDEEGDVNLDWLSFKYLRSGKTSDGLYAWLAEAYGGSANGLQRANIYRAPPELVGPYGEDDADLPLRILEKQYPILQSEGLIPLFELENRLIPLLIKMRRQGVRVDVDGAEKLYVKIGHDIETLNANLSREVGFEINVNSPEHLAKAFSEIGLKFPKTAPSKNFPDGQPSFQKEFLKGLKHPLGKSVNAIREHIKIRSTFLRGYLLEGNVKGLIHCQFHPLRNDDNGALTGRFSSSDPNLQNIPSRSELGKLIRTLFIEHLGHAAWKKFDYSQIEYRMLAHFAVNEPGGNSADLLRANYNNDPKADYHKIVQENVKLLTGMLIDRSPIKNINFGLLYGQGQDELGYKAGFDKAQAKGVFEAYHKGAPYVKPTMKHIGREVQRLGYTQTITGRRTRFRLFQPAEYGARGIPLPYEQALAEYGHNIKRAYEYKSVNYKLQGSAADVIKIAMDAAHTAGVFDYIGVPLIQVHDELGFSVIDHSPAQKEAYDFLTHTLENSVKLSIPIKVESKEGANWGVCG